jgi:hypothetical protein
MMASHTTYQAKSAFPVGLNSLWELLRGGPPAEIKWLSRILSAALWDGIRPREWDAALVERILAARNGSPSDVIANLYGYYHALDTCRIECAGKLIDLAAAQCGKSPVNFHQAVSVEAAFFEGRYRSSATRARQWLEQVKHGQVEEQTRLRGEAAVLLAEGRRVEASEKVQAALAALPQSADPGGALAETDWLNHLRTECAQGAR